MDKLTRDLLMNWGLSEYITTFKDGRVDAGTLRLLSHDEITQLLPIPGDRARFRANLENWKLEMASINTPRQQEVHEHNASFSLLDVNTEFDTSLGSIGTLLKESTYFEASPNSFATTTEVYNLDETLTPSSSTPHSAKPRKIQFKAIEETSQQQPGGSRQIVKGVDQPGLQATKETFRNKENCQQAVPNIDYTQPGYVLKTLHCSLDGKAILAQGQNLGKLTDTQRNLLVRLLILPILETNPKIIISNTQLLGWSLEIQEIFNKESPAVYYAPYISANVRSTARNASGKLLRFIYNRRRILRERGILETRSRSSSRASSIVSDPATALSDIDPDETTAEKLNWLRNSLEPWHLVEDNWNATAKCRLCSNYSGGGSVQEYFNEYPVLKRPTGYQLLLNDFKVLYEDKSDALFTNIVPLREKIIAIAKEKFKSLRDKDVKQTIGKYLSIVSDPECPEAINNVALLLLPYLTSSVPIKEKRKVTWKPSKSEVRDGFLTQIASDSEIETTIASRKTKLERFGKTLQPFVIFVGLDAANVLHSYVVVADTIYKFDTILSAVDVCFKIIQATGARYQDEALVVWMVIQKAFYRIKTEHDKEFTTVNSLLVELGIDD